MSRFARIVPRSIGKPVMLGALGLVAALAACQDDTPSPVAPPSGPLAARTGAGKPSTVETVVFAASEGGVSDIYSMSPDGTNIRRLTSDTTTEDVSPSFSPDNRKVVFVRRAGEGPSQLFTMNPDGTKQTALTPIAWNTFLDNPHYSPDGTKIVFQMTTLDPSGQGNENSDIYVINADGTGLTRLTYELAEDAEPAWSPDGKTIAFMSNRLAGDYFALYTMNAGGLDVRLIAACGTDCLEPEFSPDGLSIAYASPANGRITVVNIATKYTFGVGPVWDLGESRHPTWSRDGTRVVFASDRGAEHRMELYSGIPANIDATSVRRLTVFSPGRAFAPSYSH